MSTLTEHRTVGEIAAEYPATVRVFQRHQIDFCCGGKLPLANACESRGLAPEKLLEELEEAAAGRQTDATDWNAASLTALIDHIVRTHHEYLKSELPRLSEMLARVISKHNNKYGQIPEQLGEIFEGLRAELESHLMKEENVLFPLVEQMEAAAKAGVSAPPAHCGSVNNPIRVMVHEHDSAGGALAELRAVSRNYAVPEDACNTFRALYHDLEVLEADLHQHIHLENNVLFPRAAALEKLV
ncbi:MAG TPA: iron-sulfur cluster repair di-iron protein [Bryobacteraceae bacterium]|nr:iron-sulfur cluster repair di-iron protein [Bryobacteraceae bacterium]